MDCRIREKGKGMRAHQKLLHLLYFDKNQPVGIKIQTYYAPERRLYS